MARWDGGPRSVPQALPRVRLAGAAGALREERGELLRDVPDWGSNLRGPRAVAPPQGRLAALARRMGGAAGRVVCRQVAEHGGVVGPRAGCVHGVLGVRYREHCVA